MVANADTTTPESTSLGGLIDRYIEQVLRPCLDVPLGGGQDEFAQISYHFAKSYKSSTQLVGSLSRNSNSQLRMPQSRIGSNLYGGLPRIPMAWRQRWCAPFAT